MSEDSTFSVDADGRAQITGPLTLKTVSSVFHQAEAAASDGKAMSDLDLTNVPHVDSSGLALLLEWQSRALRNQNSLHITNAPQDLLSLANLCEANDVLSIKGRAAE
jgi:ABC-type transporter Mla MlaB component